MKTYENSCDTIAYDNEAYNSGYVAGTNVCTLNTIRMLYRMGYCAEEITNSCVELRPALVAAALDQVGRENNNSAVTNVEYAGYKGQYSYNSHYGMHAGVTLNTFPQLIFQGPSAEAVEENFRLTVYFFDSLGGYPADDGCFTDKPAIDTEWMASVGLANDIRLKNIVDAVMDAQVLVHRGASPEEAAKAVKDSLEEDESRTTGREEMACAVIVSMLKAELSVDLIAKILNIPQETVFRVLVETGYDGSEI